MKNKTYSDLAEFGKKLLEIREIDQGIMLSAEYLKKLTGAMRCSIFVYDKNKDELWTILANGMEKIVVASNQGIVGQIYTANEELIENNVEKNPHFFQAIDKDSGYQTINMLGCPIHGNRENVIGVVQLINKLDGFADEDMLFIKVILRFISSFIEISLATSADVE